MSSDLRTTNANASFEHLLSDLKEQISEKHVVAVIGAGVAAAATNGNPLATWAGLLHSGVSRCESVVPGLLSGWGDRVQKEIDSGDIDDILSAAEKITSKLRSQGGEYSRWLRETIGTLKPSDPTLIKALADLDVPLVTTNYDSLIEDVTHLPYATWRQTVEVEYLIRGDDRGVVHLHGHWRDSESVILGIRSYSDILGSDHTQAIFRALRATKTFLFIGYGSGLADPNFAALLRWARGIFSASEFRHYRLARVSDVVVLRQAHVPSDRIFVLPYGDNYGDLSTFLGSLKTPSLSTPLQATRLPERFIPSSIPFETKPVDARNTVPAALTVLPQSEQNSVSTPIVRSPLSSAQPSSLPEVIPLLEQRSSPISPPVRDSVGHTESIIPVSPSVPDLAISTPLSLVEHEDDSGAVSPSRVRLCAADDFDTGISNFNAQEYDAAINPLLKSAAENSQAMYILGLMHELGLGLLPDSSTAHTWYMRAAKSGSAEAKNCLGLLYEYGEGIPQEDKDRVAAEDYYEDASRCGSRAALENLGRLRKSLGV